MTSINRNSFTVLNSGLASAHDYLRSKFTDVTGLDNLRSIEIVDGEIPNGYALDPNKKDVLKVSKTFAEQNKIVMGLKAALDSVSVSDKEDKCYVGEIPQDEKAQLKNESLTLEEEKSHASLGFLSDILDRAYNRRTTLTSWISYFVFKSYGLKEDDFGPISKILTDGDFAKDYTEYKQITEKSQLEADEYLKTKFVGDKDSDKKQKLVKTASFLIDNYNKLNMGFVREFPKIFCFQNIAMPFLKMFLPKVKLFDFMVTINPWLCDLVSENLGNYAGEIKEIQKVEKETNKEIVISEVNLTPLSFEEFSLQRVIEHINSAVGRIFGKDSTISAMLAKKWLRRYRYMDYPKFAKQFTDDTTDEGFIKKLHEGLGDSVNSNGTKAPEDKFEKENTQEEKDKYWVAAIISRIARVATSVTPEWVKESSNLFGAIFVPLNLTMPLLAKVFNKGFFGFVTHTLIKVFPIVNELVFDHLANFRKEILDVQKETSNQSIAKLFKKIEVKSAWEAFTNSLGYLYNAMKGFASRKSSTNPAAT